MLLLLKLFYSSDAIYNNIINLKERISSLENEKNKKTKWINEMNELIEKHKNLNNESPKKLVKQKRADIEEINQEIHAVKNEIIEKSKRKIRNK